MKCSQKKLRAYALEILDTHESRAIKAHVDSCPECTRRLEELRATVAVLEGIPEVENEPVNIEAIRAAAAEGLSERGPVPGKGPRRRGWGWAFAATCGLVLAFLCFNYGLALRLGSFEIAFGGPKPEVAPSRPVPAFDEQRIRTVAREEIRSEIVPGLKELGSYIRDLAATYDQKLIALRSEFALQRALDQDELRRHFKLIASTMTEAVGKP